MKEDTNFVNPSLYKESVERYTSISYLNENLWSLCKSLYKDLPENNISLTGTLYNHEESKNRKSKPTVNKTEENTMLNCINLTNILVNATINPNQEGVYSNLFNDIKNLYLKEDLKINLSKILKEVCK